MARHELNSFGKGKVFKIIKTKRVLSERLLLQLTLGLGILNSLLIIYHIIKG